MKSVLIFRTPTAAQLEKRIVEQLSVSAAELETEIKQTILQSKPAGRTYRLNSIVRRNSRNRPAGLRSKGKGVIVGANFHRASRKGQPPAVLSGRLINSIGARRVGKFLYRVGTSVLYAPILDDPNKLDRPYFLATVRKYEPRFYSNMQKIFD